MRHDMQEENGVAMTRRDDRHADMTSHDSSDDGGDDDDGKHKRSNKACTTEK